MKGKKSTGTWRHLASQLFFNFLCNSCTIASCNLLLILLTMFTWLITFSIWDTFNALSLVLRKQISYFKTQKKTDYSPLRCLSKNVTNTVPLNVILTILKWHYFVNIKTDNLLLLTWESTIYCLLAFPLCARSD